MWPLPLLLQPFSIQDCSTCGEKNKKCVCLLLMFWLQGFKVWSLTLFIHTAWVWLPSSFCQNLLSLPVLPPVYEPFLSVIRHFFVPSRTRCDSSHSLIWLLLNMTGTDGPYRKIRERNRSVGLSRWCSVTCFTNTDTHPLLAQLWLHLFNIVSQSM